MMHLVGAVVSHVGRIRTVNEDRGLFIPHVGVVADGMGGHAGGEIASAIAVEAFNDIVADVDTAELMRLGTLANERIHDRGQEPELRGMGTTLVAISLDGELGQVSIINVGDSRAYRVVPGGIERVTRDHSFVQDLIEQGRITDVEARTHPQRNIVTRALGIEPDVEIDAFEVYVMAGDRFLLCSDGLVDEVEDRDISEVLHRVDDPKQAATELVELAFNAGGRDNITVLVADVAETHPEVSAFVDVDTPASATTDRADITGEMPVIDSGDAPAAPTAADVDTGAGVGEPDVDELDDGGLRGPIMAGLVALTLAVLAYLAIDWYGTRTFYADSVGDDVVVLQGRPEGVLWIDPEVVVVTDVDVSNLSDEGIARLGDQPLLGSREEAEAFVAGLPTLDG